MCQMPLACGVITRANAREVRADPRLAEKNMFVVHEITQDGVALAPAALDVGAVTLRAHLHRVACRTTIRAIHFLAELRGAGASSWKNFAGNQLRRLLPPNLLEILHDESIPRPKHRQQQPQENQDSIVHRTTSLEPMLQQAMQAPLIILARFASSKNCAANKTINPIVLMPMNGTTRFETPLIVSVLA